MTLMIVLNGATAALCYFSMAQFLVAGWRNPVALFGAIFAASIGTFALLEVPYFASWLGPLAGALLLIVCGKMVFFWWFAQAMFDDRFALRPIHVVPLGLTFLTTSMMLAGFYGKEVAQHLYHAITLGLLIHVVVLALRDMRGDLVDARRSFRAAVGIAIPLFAGVMIVVHTIEGITGRDLNVTMAETMITTAFAFVFALWLTRIERGLILSDPAPKPQPAKVASPADGIDLVRIRDVAESGALLEPGLTVGAFAEQLNMPEHRMRRLINQGLGYRNFSDFLNAHRVAEAERRLADPALAREQIITHAFALGYNSLTPFNRAFKARTGQSPTAFRDRALRGLQDGEPV